MLDSLPIKDIDLSSLVIRYKRKNPIRGIYKITFEDKIYIGQSIDIENRFWYYKKLRCKTQLLLYYLFNKHGVENFSFEIVHIIDSTNLSKLEINAELNILEVHYIKHFNSFKDDNKNGLNMTKGGGSIIFSEEVKAKISKSLTGKFPSEETRRKKSVAMMGEKNHMFGKSGDKHNRFGIKQTPEHIAKRAAANTGKKQSAEHKEKNRLGHLGKKFSKEVADKIQETKRRIKQERLTMIF